MADEHARLPPAVRAAPSMLSYDERALLHWAARTASPARASLVDAGAFLGGSALALASGMLARTVAEPQPSVTSYDLFEFAGEWESHWVPEGMPFRVGGSSLPVFEQTVATVRDHVDVRAGNIHRERWEGGDISVLFLDIAKSWRTGDHVSRTFFPALVPGESIVVHQDLVHWGHPWCAIVMELLADRFDFLGWVPYSSAVFRARKHVSAEDLPDSTLRALSVDDQLALLRRFAARVDGSAAGHFRLASARVLAAGGRFSDARNVVDAVEADYPSTLEPHLWEGFEETRAWLNAVESGRKGIL